MRKRISKSIFAFFAALLLATAFVYSAYATPQSHEYSGLDFAHLLQRVEPEGEGIIYDVTFMITAGYIGEPPFAALEGKGVGEGQWPPKPFREDYTFVGWYDNPERTGDPYFMDTPIYKDTELYAKWDYVGSGGYWPRPGRGVIHGIENGDCFNSNQSISITSDGYNMHLDAPKDLRFRWIPVGWRVSDAVDGSFSEEAPFTTEFSIAQQGEYTLYITYKEEIFDGVDWQETDQLQEIEELTFQIIKNGE